MFSRVLSQIRTPTNNLYRAFGRKRFKTEGKVKERKTGKIVADEKSIKLSTKEKTGGRESSENLLALRRERRIKLAPTFDYALEQKLIPEVVEEFNSRKRRRAFQLDQNPQEGHQLYFSVLDEYLEKTKNENPYKYLDFDVSKYLPQNFEYKDPELPFVKAEEYGNVEDVINGRFYKAGDVKMFEKGEGRRCGALAYKIGMTQIFDTWGVPHPVTILHLDRCQVIQAKEFEKDNVDSLQIGIGQHNANKMKKPLMGHFMRANTPYKKKTKEFEISPQNKLPVGYMIGPRHFTVGQYIDTVSMAKKKGFQGAMKRWGFKGMPASHGVSATHRHLGSTGQSCNPSRVIKGKRMHGHMGGHNRATMNLQVMKIDHEKSVILVKGSVPGKIGELVKVRDSLFCGKKNDGLLNYPTFVPQEGKRYASVVTIESSKQDPQEVYLHDEAIPKPLKGETTGGGGGSGGGDDSGASEQKNQNQQISAFFQKNNRIEKKTNGGQQHKPKGAKRAGCGKIQKEKARAQLG